MNDRENIYDAETDDDFSETDDEPVDILNSLLFVDEDGVNYYYIYFFEFFNEVIIDSEQAVQLDLDESEDLIRLDEENLYNWLLITFAESREE